MSRQKRFSKLKGISDRHHLTSSKNLHTVYISQLCAHRSQFGITKRVEGAVLNSQGDSDVNCTVTFKTRTSQQHFAIRFEELKLGCTDHLKLFDSDQDYGQESIKDFSCTDNIANVDIMRTTGSYLTIRFSSDNRTRLNDGFRLVLTAVFDRSSSLNYDCPADYSYCRNRLCISRSLFCDDVNHCLDNSDEINCSSTSKQSTSSTSSLFSNSIDLSLTNAVGLLVVIILIIFTCVILCISAIYCKRESHYAQYHHQLSRSFGVPLQTSSSVMFTNPSQQQYHYFQPSPYITPQHHATLTSAGYSTLPINLVRQNQQQLHQLHQPIVTKANNNGEYLMMAGLAATPAQAMVANPAGTMQTNLFLPSSQSIMASPGLTRFQANQQLTQHQQHPINGSQQNQSPSQPPKPPPPPSTQEPRRS